MRIVVTGGAGFIGSMVVSRLLASGHGVCVVDDLSTGSSANLFPEARFEEMDILDASLAALMTDFSPETVVHLAAQVDVSSSIRDPERDRRINVDGTVAVARAAADAGARRILSASSAAVYGEPEAVPLPETARKAPANPYGSSKLAAEGAIASVLRPAGVDFASLRFANVFGERQDWRGEGGVVAIFAAAMTQGRTPDVYGTGAQTRDFIYAGDVAAAIEAALLAEGPLALEGPDGPAYNISTGRETSVDELASMIAAAAGFEGGTRKLPAREGDIERSALDPAKAARAFGWRAATPVPDGIERTVAWFGRSGAA